MYIKDIAAATAEDEFVPMSAFFFAGTERDPALRLDWDTFPIRGHYEDWTDEWGALRRAQDSVVIGHPITDITKWRELITFPDLSGYTPARYEAVKNLELFERRRDKKCFIWCLSDGLFVTLRKLLGMDGLLAAIADNADELKELADEITEQYLIPRVELIRNAAAPCDAVMVRDDLLDANGIALGHAWDQPDLPVNGAVMDYEAARGLFYPAYKKLFRYIEACGYEAFFHSYGKFPLELADDLYGLGVDLIAGVSAYHNNDMDALLEHTAGKLFVAGGSDWLINHQFLFDAEHCRENIREACEALGKYPHFIPYHNLYVDPFSGWGAGSPCGAMRDEVSKCRR